MDEHPRGQTLTLSQIVLRATRSLTVSGHSGLSSSDGLGCPSCGTERGLIGPRFEHKCCRCADGGRIRDPNRFGMSMLCPECSGGSVSERAPEVPEESMRLPAKFRVIDFAAWLPDNGSPRLACQRYAAEWPASKPFLLLLGNKGTGKTTLACAVLRKAWYEHGARGQFWPVIDLLDRYRRTFDVDRATETLDEADQQMRRVPLLVLDDYGAHKGSEFAEERLFALIDYRYREHKPTVITSNVTLMEMSDRVRSRFTDTAVCQIVNFTGQDMRPKAGR
jgi:hypothetical protein